MRLNKSELSFDEKVAVIWCGLEESVRESDDPETAVADFFQVTVQQLRAWRAAEGRQCCPGVTTRGHSCRNYVSSIVDYDPRGWVARAPEYCPTHLRAQQEMAGSPEAAVDLSRIGASDSRAAEDDAGAIAR